MRKAACHPPPDRPTPPAWGKRRGAQSAAGFPADVVQLVEDTSRQSALELMTGVGYIDLLIPRGSAGLIKTCVETAKVPCIETGTGICHIYID